MYDFGNSSGRIQCSTEGEGEGLFTDADDEEGEAAIVVTASVWEERVEDEKVLKARPCLRFQRKNLSRAGERRCNPDGS